MPNHERDDDQNTPDGDMSGMTPESFIEGKNLATEINLFFEGLRRLRQEFKGPVTFDVLAQNVSNLGPLGQELAGHLDRYRNFFYGGAKLNVWEQSVAESVTNQLYSGGRPSYEDLQAAWDIGEQSEVPYLLFSAIERKYSEQRSGMVMEFHMNGTEVFEAPISAILEGKRARVKDISTHLVRSDSGDFYNIDGVDFEIQES